MPEMPEIETLARGLRRTIVGKRVTAVHLSGLPLRKPVADGFAVRLQGRTIIRILRRGKYLIAEMEPRAFWLIHLGMSGRILYHPIASSPMKHTQATIRFSDSSELEYQDHRRFGLLAVYDVPRVGQIPELASLGSEPLSSAFNENRLWPLLQNSRQEIKSFLLDQRKVAGLGNIYVSEALFLARLRPTRRCCSLSMNETACLVRAVRQALRSSIRHRGTSFSDFVNSDGKAGQNQNYLLVFQREGEACICCGAPISRVRQGNRSSYFCPRCQR